MDAKIRNKNAGGVPVLGREVAEPKTSGAAEAGMAKDGPMEMPRICPWLWLKLGMLITPPTLELLSPPPLLPLPLPVVEPPPPPVYVLVIVQVWAAPALKVTLPPSSQLPLKDAV